MSKHEPDFHLTSQGDTATSLVASPERLMDFEAIIDVRSPAEFEEDHIYGAINCPALSNEERAKVGALHKHNPFEARKLGAAYISHNMSVYLQTTLATYKKYWKPLVYCWRGGMRSGSIVHIMQQIGWQAHQLEGGYKGYRQYILDALEKLPHKNNFIVLCGPTGSGKSRLLQVLERKGHQVLDLEGLASHRGSLLGLLPGVTQPGQRYFETCLHHQLQQFSPDRPIYIESESRRIGQLTLPAALFQRMQESPCLQVEVPLDERIRFLCEDYRCYIDSPDLLLEKMKRLAPYHAKTLITHWNTLMEEGHYEELVKGLLLEHYDPLYWRSTHEHHAHIDESPKLKISRLDEASLEAVVEVM